MIQDTLCNTHNKEVLFDLVSEQKPFQFDDAKIEDFRSQDDFNYTEYVAPDNWWTHFKNWISQLWSKFISWVFGIDEVSGFWLVFFKLLPYLLVIAVLFLLGWLFMKVNPSDMLFEKQAPPQVALTEDEDIIQNENINQLIDHALVQKNYRLAIRYYYLLVLKKLSDSELIQWESQKTNTDYISELTDTTVQKQFTSITRLYNFIWYGSFEINEKAYLEAAKEFSALTHSIQD